MTTLIEIQRDRESSAVTYAVAQSDTKYICQIAADTVQSVAVPAGMTTVMIEVSNDAFFSDSATIAALPSSATFTTAGFELLVPGKWNMRFNVSGKTLYFRCPLQSYISLSFYK